MVHLDLFSGIGGFSLGLNKVFDIKETYFSLVTESTSYRYVRERVTLG